MAQEYAATGKYTTLDPTRLAESMGRLEGVCVVATVNEDATPNAAIFVPTMPDESHVALVLGPNRTRENIERTGTCAMVYDVMDPTATTKADSHRGARLALSLVRPDEEEHARVEAAWPHFNEYTLLLRVERLELVG